jgi:regulator of sigma E protease
MNFFLYYIIPAILLLGILIFFHELGHFFVAKLFGVKVLKFSLGFGPKLIGKKIGETEYLISSLPLGGYVKMLGEGEDENATDLSPEDELKSFNKQHVLKRMAIVSAGPIFNFFLALIVYCVFFMVVGTGILIPEIGEVNKNTPAQNAGLEKGDLIVSVDEFSIESWKQMRDIVQESAGKRLNVTVKRGERLITVSIVPKVSVAKNLFGEDIETFLIGIVASGRVEIVALSPVGAIAEGFRETWKMIKLTCITIVKLIQRVIPLKTLGGPIMIGQLTGKLAQENLTYLFPLLAVISINLGILNLLPVPILDGGFIIFLFIELIMGKPLSQKKREMAQKAGLAILVMLMAVVIYNDVTRLFK